MKKSIFLFFAAILCAMTANAWGYKTAAGSWNDCSGSTSKFKNVTMNSGISHDVVMLKDVGDGLNILQNECDGQALYCKWTKASGDIFRGTARWNNGLYCDETVVIPEGKVYIKVGSGEQVQMTAGADYIYTADVTISTTGESYTISGGTVNGATINNENGMPAGGKPSTLTMSNSYTSKKSGNVHIVFDLKTNKVTETADSEPEPEPVADVTVHFINSVEWAAVACHHWGAGGSGTSWPGDVLSKTDVIAGYDVYTATFPGEHTSCIFNNNNGNQTGDLTVEDGKYYEVNTNTWYADKAAAEAALATPIPDETVYFINTGNWSKVMIYTWNGVGGTAWPGVEMTPTGETIEGYDVYSYTAKQGGQANLLFQESADVNKTGDLEWEAGKYYAPSKDTWYDTKEDAAEALAVPLADETVYFVNNKQWASVAIYGWGGTASTSEGIGKWAGADMTKTTEQVAGFDVYSYTAKEGTVKNILFNYNGDENKTSDFVWTNGKYYYMDEGAQKDKNFAGGTKDEVDAIVSAPVVDNYYVSGTFNGWASNDDAKLTLDGELYTKELTLDVGTHMFKVQKNNWAGEWGYSHVEGYYVGMEEGTNDDGDKNNNIKLNLDAQTTFTVKFNLANNEITFEGLTEDVTETLVYYVEVPEGTEDCYIAGQMNNWEFVRMTQADATHWTITYDNVLKTTEYKYACQASWDYKELDKEGNEVANRTWTELDKVEKWAEPAKCYLMGIGGDWTKGIEMEANPDNANEFRLLCQPIAEGEQFKFKYGDTWSTDVENYEENGVEWVETELGSGQHNMTLPEGLYDFYFKKDTKKIYIAAATDCELATITLTTGNNDDVITANIGKTVNVKIDRSFTANDGFYTLCVPFNMPASVIGKAYSLGTITKHVTDESIDIELEEVTYELSAGVPYLVLPKADMSELVVENVTIESVEASGQNITKSELNVQIFFEGFYSASGQTNGTTQYYVGNNGYLYNEVVDIRGLSGLFTINDANGAPFEVRARVVTREDEATGFENITNGENTTIKLIENGQLIIIRGGEKFNAQGQKL